MRCQQYKEALQESVVSGEVLKRPIQEHVQACAQCRETLRSERVLLDEMDSALRARMEEKPRPGFLTAVGAKLSQEPGPKPLVSPAWALAAMAAVAVLVMAAMWSKWHKVPGGVGSPTLAAVRHQPEPRVVEPRNSVAVPAQSLRPIKKHTVAKRVPRPQPEVLVPADEREALANFVTHLRQRDEIARALASPPVDVGGELSEIKPVEIARLQLKRLAWESWE